MHSSLKWKFAYILLVTAGSSLANIFLASQSSFQVTVYSDVSAEPSPLRELVGTFNAYGVGKAEVQNMMPTLDGWVSRDISYSWENIRTYYQLDSLAVYEYADPQSSALAYVFILPVDVGTLEIFHRPEWCYATQGLKVVSRDTTSFTFSGYLGPDKVEFTFYVNVWKLLIRGRMDRGWVALQWYVFTSVGNQLTEKVYFVQVEHYFTEESYEQALENSMVFAEKTMNSMMRCITEQTG